MEDETSYTYYVATECMTYNHGNYIKDTLCGFAIQETNFPVVYVVVDDASTDGEPDVIRNWANINLIKKDGVELCRNLPYGQLIEGTLRGKPQSTFVMLLLSENYYQSGNGLKKYEFITKWLNNAKYHAICEGDDFWVSPQKLHKQVDFMESHPEYSMCFHNAVVIYDDMPQRPRVFNSIERNKDVSLEELISKWIVPTASMIYRNSCLPLFPVKEKIVSGDYRMILHFAGKGKVFALKDVMSVYRMTFYTDSATSRNKDNGAFMCYQKHHILDCFDEFTQYKYHDIVGKYSKFWYDYSVFTRRKHKSVLWAILSMPRFSIKKYLKII